MKNAKSLKNVLDKHKLEIFQKINDGLQQCLYYSFGEKKTISGWIQKSSPNNDKKRKINQNAADLGKQTGIFMENHLPLYCKMMNSKSDIISTNESGYDILYQSKPFELKCSRQSNVNDRFIFSGNSYACDKSLNIILFGYTVDESLPIQKKIVKNFITKFYLSVHENINLNEFWKVCENFKNRKDDKKNNCAFSSLKIPSLFYDKMKTGLIHGEILKTTKKTKKESLTLSFSATSL